MNGCSATLINILLAEIASLSICCLQHFRFVCTDVEYAERFAAEWLLCSIKRWGELNLLTSTLIYPWTCMTLKNWCIRGWTLNKKATITFSFDLIDDSWVVSHTVGSCVDIGLSFSLLLCDDSEMVDSRTSDAICLFSLKPVLQPYYTWYSREVCHLNTSSLSDIWTTFASHERYKFLHSEKGWHIRNSCSQWLMRVFWENDMHYYRGITYISLWRVSLANASKH